jgi:hypothetical protein
MEELWRNLRVARAVRRFLPAAAWRTPLSHKGKKSAGSMRCSDCGVIETTTPPP